MASSVAFIESAIDVMLAADCFSEEARAHEATRESLRDMADALDDAGLIREAPNA